MKALRPDIGGDWTKMEAFEKECTQKTEESPLLNYVLRYCAHAMSYRKGEFKTKWSESKTQWANIAKEISATDPENLFLQIHFIELSKSIWEMRSDTKNAIQKVGNRHPADMWHLGIGLKGDHYSLSGQHRARLSNLRFIIYAKEYKDPKDSELHTLYKKQIYMSPQSPQYYEAYAKYLD